MDGRGSPDKSVSQHLGVTMAGASYQENVSVSRAGKVNCVTSLTVEMAVTQTMGTATLLVSASAR